MITPSFALTATERVLPKLALDFTTATLDSRVTFTRSGDTATVIDTSGNIAPINADLPRFDFNLGTGGACKGLLIEETRSNIFLNSILSGAANGSPGTPPTSWSIGFGAGATTTLQTSLYGTLDNAQAIKFSGTSVRIMYQQTITVVSGQQYAFSCFIEDISGNIGNFLTVVNGTATVTINTTVLNPTEPNRYTLLFTATSSGTCTGRIGIGTTSATSGSVSVTFSRPQLEEGAKETSYIPTGATTVTRNADVGVMTGTNFSDWYNATEGGAVVQVLPSTITGTRPAVQFDDNTADELIALRGVAADPQLFVVAGGVTQATLDAGTIAANTLYKLGGAWKDASYAVALNGAAPVTQSSGTFPTATQARLGSDGTNSLNGHLQSLRVWSQQLTNAEVQAFSK